MRLFGSITAAVSLAVALPLAAANPTLTFTERPIVKQLPLDPSGSFWVDNPVGNIEIVGIDGATVSVVATRTVSGIDRDAVREGQLQTKVAFEGDSHMQLARTLIPPVHDPRWTCSVNYVIKVPRTANVRIGSKGAESIRIANMMGSVTVKAFNGRIVLDSVVGASAVDTVNGMVIYNYAGKPLSNAQITAINASIEVHVPPDARFDWVGQSLRNDFMTTFQPRVRFSSGPTHPFRASINGTGGAATITTVTMMGAVRVFANGTTLADARTIYQQQVAEFPPDATITRAPLIRQIQIPIVTQDLVYDVEIADFHVAEVRGSANLRARAGSLQLDRVYGDTLITSLGGPLTLGELMRRMDVHTGGGNIIVRSVREGGAASTDGGSIRVLYTGGPLTLRSGGGDIVVHQAAAAVSADTKSGDILISMDASLHTARVDAKTSKGNVTLNLNPAFAADVDAIVYTSDADADVIHSDFNGLSIRKEQVAGETRVHAFGKINGGGDRIELVAKDGTIQITSQAP